MPFTKTTATYRTPERYVRIICDADGYCGGEKFLTRDQYREQMNDFNRPWRCPDCREYPCAFDDEYYELPLRQE